MAHTPGNYIWDGNVRIDTDAVKQEKPGDTSNMIALVYSRRVGDDGDIASNGHLFAAAPAMLEALRQMVVNSEADGHGYRDCHKKAVAAIAKAEGR
jgi:hypothetical protein